VIKNLISDQNIGGGGDLELAIAIDNYILANSAPRVHHDKLRGLNRSVACK